MTPGRKFSATMSAVSAMRRNTALPSSERRSRAMLRLLRFSARNPPAMSWVRRDAHAPRVVAGAGPLDLDDVGAHVGQQHGAHGAGHDLRQVQHFDADQRAGRMVVLGHSHHLH